MHSDGPDQKIDFLQIPCGMDYGNLHPKNDCLTVKDLQHCRPMPYTHSISIKFGQWAQDCVLTSQNNI